MASQTECKSRALFLLFSFIVICGGGGGYGLLTRGRQKDRRNPTLHRGTLLPRDDLRIEFVDRGSIERLSAGFPAESGLLFLIDRQNGKTRIRKPSDLTGMVTIRTKDNALLFCRLFTALGTVRCIDEVAPAVSDVIEVLPLGTMEERQLLFGRPIAMFLDNRRFESLKLATPLISNRGDSFVVERNLLQREANGDLVLYRSAEELRRNGLYSHKRKQVLRKGQIEGIDWPLIM